MFYFFQFCIFTASKCCFFFSLLEFPLCFNHARLKIFTTRKDFRAHERDLGRDSSDSFLLLLMLVVCPSGLRFSCPIFGERHLGRARRFSIAILDQIFSLSLPLGIFPSVDKIQKSSSCSAISIL